MGEVSRGVIKEASMRRTIPALVCGTVCLFSAHAFAQITPTAQQLQRELGIMKEQMRQMQEKIRQQEEAIEKLATQPPPAPPAPMPSAADTHEQLKQEVRQEVLRDIQPQIAAANKTFPSQFNPAIGLIIDTTFSHRQHKGENFDFRAAELGLSASIDPFARGYAVLSGTPDGFEVEEAAI